MSPQSEENKREIERLRVSRKAVEEDFRSIFALLQNIVRELDAMQFGHATKRANAIYSLAMCVKESVDDTYDRALSFLQ